MLVDELGVVLLEEEEVEFEDEEEEAVEEEAGFEEEEAELEVEEPTSLLEAEEVELVPGRESAKEDEATLFRSEEPKNHLKEQPDKTKGNSTKIRAEMFLECFISF